MKVFVAKILFEGIDLNSCSVIVSKNLKDCKKKAEQEIQEYADEYQTTYEVKDMGYSMQSGDIYVTIDIEEHEI